MSNTYFKLPAMLEKHCRIWYNCNWRCFMEI